jgi:hypothetical protein
MRPVFETSQKLSKGWGGEEAESDGCAVNKVLDDAEVLVLVLMM